ncbi:O-antigen polymerase [Sphingomonas sp.]|uniref:O-antigen polymerase n=1 Tax=Sphingomonas sp. TaxID=28214 RepID=UPI001800DE30|nr:O-antigen polymerase [Sphingomonas sp.]MBA3511182.1 oligosaccharide repeat unit polymerase [Sphingomonas sp.]
MTGELVKGVQAALFGLQGGGDAAFTAATVIAVATDLARIAPLLYYARHPLGILHPLILTAVLWPLLVAMPRTIEELGGFGGLLLGEQVGPPFYSGLGWLPGPEIWQAVAWSNLCELIALLSIYVGYSLVRDRRVIAANSATRGVKKEFDGKRLRILAIGLIAVSVGVLLVLISLRGGLALHLADMARGRFRSMAGLGPLVAAVDLGLIALIVWVAARPNDVKRPIFLILMIGAAVAQFISNGARTSAFVVFMLVGLTWALRTRRIPWRIALIMMPVFFLSLGALNIIRSSGLVGETAAEAIQGTNTRDILSQAQEEIDLRRSVQSTVPVIWEGHHLMGGPLWGSTYAAAVLAFVPRWIWSEKPRGPGSIYAQTFLGEVREGMAVPVNSTAEEYWNFGILGVILISVLYGALIHHAHNFYIRSPDNPFVVTAFALFVSSFSPSTDQLVLFQQQVVMLLMVLGVASLFASRWRSDTSHYSPSYRAALSRPHALPYRRPEASTPAGS